MKKPIILILLFAFNYTFSQTGKIYPKDSEIKSGEKNTYIYEPPKGLFLPENVLANVAYKEFNTKTIPMIKKENGYEFSLKVPESIDVVFFSICDKKQNSLDTNLDKGYVLYLKDKSSKGFEKTLLAKIETTGMASYYLKLNYTDEDILDQYETLYATYPYLKNESSYANYLFIKFSTNKEETRPELIGFAEKLINEGDEKSLTVAHRIYSRFEMKDEMDEIEKTAIKKYPKGEIAKDNFFRKFYSTEDKSETYILNGLEEYVSTFNDSSENSMSRFYRPLITLYLDNRDTLNLTKYENLIADKFLIANTYGGYAWKLSGEDIKGPGTDLDFAEQLSRKSIDIVENRMMHPKESDDSSQLQEMHRAFADTYALIMYKQKKYDLAFQYQHEIALALQDEWDYTPGKERYAIFAEKVKGLEFAKDYLEKELLKGVDSKVMNNQLREIYMKLNLPEDEFEKIKEQSLILAAQKAKENIINRFGDIKAIDFTLTNLEGEKVTLSDYKGKVVVLDFWATWCGPCIGSFPKMQELVTKFENDNVEFFFINTWENKAPDEVKKKVVEFLEDNNYSFNVLFDYEDDIVDKYKVRGIPTTIAIDKNGDIISIVRYNDDLAAIINENM
jgi:thiol-disulfide isomerase/thioredoxin